MAPNLIGKIADALHLPGTHKSGDETQAVATAEGASKKPIFDNEKVTVIFVLGGPGAGTPFPFPPLLTHSFPLPHDASSLSFGNIGKGTQCTLLVERFNFSHLSAGDLLRAEQERPDSQYGDLIRNCIREGLIVPMHVTVKLLENAMRATLQSKSGAGWDDGKGRFLIDGFPRKMDQSTKFEEDVRDSP